MSVPQVALRALTLDLHAWPTPLRCADLWWQRGGTPVPKGRPRFVVTRAGHVRAVTPEATRAAESAIRCYAAAALPGAPVRGAVGVRLAFYLPHRRRLDADNLGKLVLDAWNGVVFADDSQILELHIAVRRGTAAGCWEGLVYDLDSRAQAVGIDVPESA